MVMRIGGLATGLDTDSIVKDLMKAHRIPVNKLYQKKQYVEWQRDAYRAINTQILDFRTNKMSSYRLEGTFLAKKVELSGNTAAVSAKAATGSQTGTLAIEVTSLATAATKQGVSDIRSAVDFDSSLKLGGQDGKLAGNFTQTVPGTYDTYKFKINGTEITVNPNVDSLDEVISRINKDTNVTAFYDTATGKMSFSAKETGAVNGITKDQAYITFEDTSPVAGNFLKDILKVDTAANGAADSSAGADADIKINGLQTSRTSNTFTVNGVEVTLKAPSGGTATTISVSNDVDKLIDTVKQFITDYNDMLSTLQGKVNEGRHRDFTPLTDEQKEEMSDKEIEAWEEKAKSGLLKNDSILSKAISDLRMSATSQVDTGSGVYETLSSIGITTGSYLENGKLYLTDETKLRTALETNPDAVNALFTASGNGDKDRSDMGIAARMYEDLNIAADEISKKAGSAISLYDNSFLGKNLEQLLQQIDAGNERLTDLEDRYYRQFTALEKAIQRFNMQSSYLTNAFGGGQQ